jgi:hypothetical protein
VLPKGVRRAVQERVVTRAVEMLQLANQVGLGKVLRAHTRHVVLLRPGRSSKGFEAYRHGPEHRKVGAALRQHAGEQQMGN